MMHLTSKALALALAFGCAATIVASGSAEAKKGKEFYSETYRTKKPLHGYEGRVGDYYCSYHRVPVHKVDKNGRMKVVGWELRQHCY